MTEEPAISVRGLTKTFGSRKVVDGIDLVVRKGEIFGFLGPNGSGKTTTIRMLCGLLIPDSGEGECLGWDIRLSGALIKQNVGYMTQRFSLYEDLSVEENLLFLARLHSVPNKRHRVSEIIERMQLEPFRRQLAGSLSGGWKQRLSLAACILHRPSLILLDEPTAGVDPSARREFWAEIHKMAADGVTILVSTHYMDEAERCHRLACMASGKIFAVGTVDDVVSECGLHSCRVTGPTADIASFSLQLSNGYPDLMAASFGLALHVSSTSVSRLADAMSLIPSSSKLSTEPCKSGLEEVFIYLMSQAGRR